MEPFYANLPPELALDVEQRARLLYALRGARDEILARLGAGDADQALACLRRGELPEHPAYDDILSARILADLHAQVRSDLATLLADSQR